MRAIITPATGRKPRRAPIKASGCAAALGLLASALLAGPAAATPTLTETMSFARSEINRFCDDEALSWFDEIDERPVSRSCRATLTRNKLSMQVSYQHEAQRDAVADTPTLAAAERASEIGAESAGAGATSVADLAPVRISADRFHAGRKFIELEFDSRSNFLCGPSRANGYAPLYFNCVGESAVSDQSCVIERQERWGDGGRRSVVQKARSFALLFNLRAQECQMVRNALNFIVERTPTPPEVEIRDFFRE